MLTIGSLFSGIGGFELGLEQTGGFKTIWQCEIDPFCQQVLAKHWPNVKRFSDITSMGIDEDIPYVDVICGGFPCQPVSVAGKRKGDCDERWMWPEFYRIICQVRPKWVIIENVPGLLSFDSGRLFRSVLWDLSKMGYNAEWKIISCNEFGLLHQRKRIFIVAHSSRISIPIKVLEFNSGNKKYDNASKILDPLCIETEFFEQRLWPSEPRIWRVVNGIPNWVDRIKSIGNSVSPVVIYNIGLKILHYDNGIIGVL